MDEPAVGAPSVPGRRRTTPIRVVFLDHVARLSGAEIGLLRLMVALEDVDKHVVLAEDGDLVAQLRQRGATVEVLPLAARTRDLRRDRVRVSTGMLTAALSTTAYTLRLARRLRRLRPDVVHTYSLKAAVYGGLAARMAGIPVVWHVHDRVSPDYLPQGAVRVIRWLAPRLNDAIIANSRSTLEALKLPRSSSVMTHIIPYALDAPTRPPTVRGIAPRTRDVFTVGMVGRLAPWKGQDLFIDAFHRAFAGSAARAVIVGAPLFGEEPFETELRQRAKRLGLDDRIEFLGFRNDVSELLDGFDVLVHASVIAEPFGQVVVEGMRAGLPVVAPNAGGPAELIENGITGFLYPLGDREALASILRKLAGDDDLRFRVGAAASTRVQEFQPGVIGRHVTEVYEAVLWSHRAIRRRPA